MIKHRVSDLTIIHHPPSSTPHTLATPPPLHMSLSFSALSAAVEARDRTAVVSFFKNFHRVIYDWRDESFVEIAEMAEVYYNDVDLLLFIAETLHSSTINSPPEYEDTEGLIMNTIENVVQEKKCYDSLKVLYALPRQDSRAEEIGHLVIDDDISPADFETLVDFVYDRVYVDISYVLRLIMHDVVKQTRTEESWTRVAVCCEYLFAKGASMSQRMRDAHARFFASKTNYPMTTLFLDNGADFNKLNKTYQKRIEKIRLRKLDTLILGLGDKKSVIYKNIIAADLGERHVLNLIVDIVGY